ncbi:MAG TPA: peptide-methionine (R)-S-oxide reductase MsrB [Cytophagaceae bacterium]|jgi:peptide-methionine (R)-S-oxide reductase|nr:peptide-methionine (R)-S-oxide reductase MsrB [Cytophagaceae bacterium]
MKLNFLHLILLAGILFLVHSCQKKAGSTASITTMKDTDHSKNPYYSRTDTTKLHLTDEDWKKVLPDSIYVVSRKKGTEYAFSGKYWDFEGIGTYYCVACGNALFRSDAKFASTCGWPSFFKTIRSNSVEYIPDNTHGMERTEVTCGRCGGHLGHIFDDGPPPTGKRFCMNSLVLDFSPDKK